LQLATFVFSRQEKSSGDAKPAAAIGWNSSVALRYDSWPGQQQPQPQPMIRRFLDVVKRAFIPVQTRRGFAENVRNGFSENVLHRHAIEAGRLFSLGSRER
jgi:hypothetical protein